MKKYSLWIIALVIFLNSQIFAQDFKRSFDVRPEITLGKDVNGNRAIEVIPARVAVHLAEEWWFKFGYSVNYTAPREGGGFNHFGQKIPVRVEYKPLKFLQDIFPNLKSNLTDFTLSFEKNFGGLYEGANNPVSYAWDCMPYEKIGIGFNMTFYDK